VLAAELIGSLYLSCAYTAIFGAGELTEEKSHHSEKIVHVKIAKIAPST
jgi:hypothetical protein